MPRHPRLFVPGATYHVYCRVARGEHVFDDKLEADQFVEAVCRIRDFHEWRILAWVLMGNHYHLVVKTGGVPLWRSMLRLQADVARDFNKRHRYLGRLWQSRYRARIIDTQDYLRQAVAYVHLNPVAAGIVADPAEHHYSGHSEILGLKPLRLIDLNQVLSGFVDGHLGETRNSYLSWIRNVAESRWIDQGLRELPWWREGSDVDEIVPPDHRPEPKTFNDRTIEDDRITLGIDEFGSLYERCSGHTLEALASPLRRSELVNARIEYATLAVVRYGIRSTEAAQLIRKHPASIIRWTEHGILDLKSCRRFRARIDDLDREISRMARTNP